MPQFVQVRFGTSPRLYAYRNEGHPFEVGEVGVVEAKAGPQRVTVVEILDTPPPFNCKPIMREALI